MQHSAVQCRPWARRWRSRRQRCRWTSEEVQAQRCRVPRVAGRKWTVGAGWTCNERATMLYALYVRARMCQMLWDGCYAMLWACSALLCGAKGKQRDAVSMQQVGEWANPRRLTAWPGRLLAGKIIWRKKEGGRGQARQAGQVRMRRWVWFGLVWFMILALVLVLAGPGSGKVQSRAVRCGLWLHAQAGNEPGWGLVPGRATRVPRYSSRNPP